jgi:3-deoxy-7-phosphoheptulonate synthase
MEKAGVKPRIMIDCSHANSGKDFRKQGAVCRNVQEQIAGGDSRIMGVMIESNLVEGAQSLINGKAHIHGQSITDACIGWAETEDLLGELAESVSKRRKLRGGQGT